MQTRILLPEHPNQGIFKEVALHLAYALNKLGKETFIEIGDIKTAEANYIILAGMTHRIPVEDCIVWNLEHYGTDDRHESVYGEIMSKARVVFDWTVINAVAKEHPYLPYGFTPLMMAEPPAPLHERYYDVAFVGHLNTRRMRVLKQIADLKISLVLAHNLHGAEKYNFYSRSRLVLNIKSFDDVACETVRLLPCMARSMACVSESRGNVLDEDERQLADGCYFAEYEKIAENVAWLLNHPAEIEKLQRDAFNTAIRNDMISAVVKSGLLGWLK